MSDFWFFKTVVDKGRSRLRPLAGQLLWGDAVDQSLNVQSDRVIRSLYPIGTVFGSETLSLGSGYYQAGAIYPLGLRDDEYKSAEHRPSEGMQRAYEKYIGASGSEEEFRDDDEDEIPLIDDDYDDYDEEDYGDDEDDEDEEDL